MEHHGRTSNAAMGLAFSVYFAVTVFAASTAHSQTYEVLHSFAGGSDGGGPFAGLLTLDPEGNIYGTTTYGGTFGYGTLFRLNAEGDNTVLHAFTGGSDESKPYGGVIRDVEGNLYGTTAGGYDSGSPYGTVFKLSIRGGLTSLHFRGGKDGVYPVGGLLADGKGNFYGVTDKGGEFGFGTVFEVCKAGTERILYSFHNQPDGAFPLYETLVMDSNRNLYGTTYAGGALNQGTVFKVNASTGAEKILYSFGGGEDGALPYSGLLLDTDGNLYGTTSNGGGAGAGAVFKLSPTGKETLLYKFLGGTDGIFPLGSLVRDASGDFYGTTMYGGANGEGTVYRLTGNGQETLLHSFDWPEGMNPYGGLVLDAAGNFYGTAAVGGANGVGTVFKITP